jgi:hypothetical protein
MQTYKTPVCVRVVSTPMQTVKPALYPLAQRLIASYVIAVKSHNSLPRPDRQGFYFVYHCPSESSFSFVALKLPELSALAFEVPASCCEVKLSL